MTKRRVVVTGFGALSPFGNGAKSLFDGVFSGKSAISKITSFDTDGLSCKIAGQIEKNFESVLSEKEQRKIDPFILYAIEAAEEAINHSGFSPANESEQERSGVIVGSGIGGLQYIHDTAAVLDKSGARRVTPYFIPASLINLSSGHISIRHGLKGPNHSVVTACATGTHAIGDAFRIIQFGDADVMIAGSSEAAVSRLGMSGFCSARALSTNFNETPELASRPWDKKRDGFVMGEGAGILVLEELSFAKKRNAKIYAEVVGYGMSGDAHHVTAPSLGGDGAFRAMRSALQNSGLTIDSIDYINAHGTSTLPGDLAEVAAIKKLFGQDTKTAISSTKSSIGHLLGAAGSVEAIISIMAMNADLAPPTINLDDPDDGCDLNFVPKEAQQMNIDHAMSNSFGFGGTNASIIFSKYKD